MIKNITKKILARGKQVKSFIQIDYLYYASSATLISGWFVDKEKDALRELKLSDNKKNELSIEVFYFDRADVVQNLELLDNSHAFGFIGIINKSNLSLKGVHANINRQLYPLSKMKPVTTSNVKLLLGQALDKGGIAQDFVEKYGINVSQNTPTNVLPKVIDKDIEKIKETLAKADVYSSSYYDDCIREYIPRLHRVWSARTKKPNTAKEVCYGNLPANPKVSIIIPLYGRIDFVQHQIACFSNDPSFIDIEVIYVLDDPRLKRELEVFALGNSKVFDFSFKVIYSENNLGFAGANNLGSQFATSNKLLLLNSDIIPVNNGWLNELVKQFDSAENCGILGATLLYEDNTIQHIGMEFQQNVNFPNIWLNIHPDKGFPISLIKPFDIKPVPLVTGACMLIEKELYRSVGGFDEKFILGDFEDSELCLKCIDKGYKIYVSGKVSLYHLERLSQNLVDSGDWKFKLTLLNGAYQSSKWSNLIEELSQ